MKLDYPYVFGKSQNNYHYKQEKFKLNLDAFAIVQNQKLREIYRLL